MKKIFVLFMVIVMTAFPVVSFGADKVYTQEELIVLARELCSIEPMEEFSVTDKSNYCGITVYDFLWTDNEDNSKRVEISDRGEIYSYFKSTPETTSKKSVLSKEDAEKKAMEFMKTVIGARADNLLEKNFRIYNDNVYALSYDKYVNGVSFYHNEVKLEINKYTGDIEDFEYPMELDFAPTDAFTTAHSVADAKNAVAENMEIGYKVVYNREKEKEEAILIYRPESYMLNADDLTEVTFDDIMYDTASASEGSGAYKNQELTDAEREALIKLGNAVSVEKAVAVYNSVLGDNLTVDEINYSYSFENVDKKTYRLTATFMKDNLYCSFTVDSKGRLISYSRNYMNAVENESKELSDEERANIITSLGEKTIKALNTDNMELGELEIDTGKYGGVCANIKRNGYISFDEELSVNFDNMGNISYLYANYSDDVFEDAPSKAVITSQQAVEKADAVVPLKPGYIIRTIYDESVNNTTYSSIQAFCYDKEFNVNAVNGDVLNYYYSEFKNDDGVKTYSDVTDQWYADAVNYLALCGYYFDSDEFNGSMPLTCGDMEQLDYYLALCIDDDVDESTILTRYDFAECLVRFMELDEIMDCNDIFIKTFEDVDNEHTAVAAILKGKGIVTDSEFRGNDAITRAEAAVMLYRYLSNK